MAARIQRQESLPPDWEVALERTRKSLEELRKNLVMSKGDKKAKEAIPKLLDNFMENCVSLKKFKMKQVESSPELLQLVKLLQQFDKELETDPSHDPDWRQQLSVLQVALFWQVMYQLRTYLVEPVERAFVASKRFLPGGRVQEVSNERL